MISLSNENKARVLGLFENYKWNYIPDAIIEGNMGAVLVDDETNPHFAVLALPKLKLFMLGGDAAHPAAKGYLKSLPYLSMIFCANPALEALSTEVYRGRYFKLDRYAFTSENLDSRYLKTLAAKLPDGYKLQQIDLPLAKKSPLRKVALQKSNW
ncbi:MAG: GNAT family N-acetyltransferase [Anaerolineae bacterium]|nr:GNAT family N-acetyltransferase [Anaerolineae bacterium]